MDVALASFSYPAVGATDRERITRRIGDLELPHPAFTLATCLRIEIATPYGEDALDDILSEMWGDTPQVVAPDRLTGPDAVHQLFRVAAGLESPVIGEIDVFNQFRMALAETGGDGRFLRLLQRAVASAREARPLLPDTPHTSMADVAADLVGDVPRVAVIGAGEMGRTAATSLVARGADVTMLVRSPATAKTVVPDVRPMTELAHILCEYDAVVSATNSTHTLIDSAELTAILDRRTTRLALVDLALPPDFRPGDHHAVAYTGVDEIAAASAGHGAAAAGDLIHAKAIEAFEEAVNHRSVGEMARRLIELADESASVAADKFTGRMSSIRDAELLREATRAVARTLMAQPLTTIKGSEQDRDAVARTYGLEA